MAPSSDVIRRHVELIAEILARLCVGVARIKTARAIEGAATPQRHVEIHLEPHAEDREPMKKSNASDKALSMTCVGRVRVPSWRMIVGVHCQRIVPRRGQIQDRAAKVAAGDGGGLVMMRGVLYWRQAREFDDAPRERGRGDLRKEVAFDRRNVMQRCPGIERTRFFKGSSLESKTSAAAFVMGALPE